MRIEDLDYDLPRELVAQSPLERRDSSRLMVLHRATGRFEHSSFTRLAEHLAPEALLVINETRVFPARIACSKPTGGAVEVLLVRRLEVQGRCERWSALLGSSRTPRSGTTLHSPNLRMAVVGRLDGGLHELELEPESEDGAASVSGAVQADGATPLPPYIRRPADPSDAERYQTVYSRVGGSVAAPTAGLHFTPELLALLESRGHAIARIVLHVGPGTFQPVRSERIEDHSMLAEWVTVTAEAAGVIVRAREIGRRIVAVGTTVVRALEGVHAMAGGIAAWDGPVSLMILPGHRLTVVDDLITNFHLPRSTLLALVMALVGRQGVARAYAEAIRERYRFYSYGDAMLVIE